MPLDCHLMIDDPDRWAVGYAEAGAYNVTVHVEAAADPVALARDLRAAGALAGLSIKPDTPLEPHLETLRHFDTLLVMSVEPGFGGQRFIPEVLDKVRTARRLVDTGHLRLLVEIDGGINADTIEAAAEAGVDCFVAGSAVYGADDPATAVARCASRCGSPHRTGGRMSRRGCRPWRSRKAEHDMTRPLRGAVPHDPADDPTLPRPRGLRPRARCTGRSPRPTRCTAPPARTRPSARWSSTPAGASWESGRRHRPVGRTPR